MIALLAFNLRIEPADLRNPVIIVFPDEPGERDHAAGISGDGRPSSLNAEAANLPGPQCVPDMTSVSALFPMLPDKPLS